MAQARISSLEALRDVKFALQRFIEDATSALTEVDGDGQRTEQWLRFEQVAYWQAQLRQRHDGVEAAKAEFRRKQLTAAPDTPTAIDERRRIERAKVKVDEAEEKLRHLKRWMTVMERERTLYKGQVNSLADALGRELPAAIVRLERMIAGVEAYASLTGGAPASEGGSGGVSAARPIRDPVAAAARLAGLRRRSPGPASRAAAEESVQSVPARPDELLAGPEGGLLLFLGVAGADPASDPVAGAKAKVVIEEGAPEAPAFYLERLRESPAGDSGWSIGLASPMAEPATGWFSMGVGELAARRPGMAELFALPPGYLVVVVAGGIEAVLDPEDRVVYGEP